MLRQTDMRWRPILALMLCFAPAACGANSPDAPPGIFFPTVPAQDAYPTALMGGVLEVRSRCIFVDRWLLLWPEGYTARLANGRLEVLDETRDVVAIESAQIRVGGGETNPVEVGGADAAERWATDLTGLNIPERCGDLYWIVSPN